MLIGRHSIGNTTPAIVERLTSRNGATVWIPPVIHRLDCSQNCICVKLITLQVALFQQHNQISDMRSLDLVSDQLADGRRFPALTVVDVYTRESLAIEAGQSLRGEDVVLTGPRFCTK